MGDDIGQVVVTCFPMPLFCACACWYNYLQQQVITKWDKNNMNNPYYQLPGWQRSKTGRLVCQWAECQGYKLRSGFPNLFCGLGCWFCTPVCVLGIVLWHFFVHFGVTWGSLQRKKDSAFSWLYCKQHSETAFARGKVRNAKCLHISTVRSSLRFPICSKSQCPKVVIFWGKI